MGARPLERLIVLFLSRWAGIVAHDYGGSMAIAPEMLVIDLDRFSYVPKAIGWDDEIKVVRLHHHSAGMVQINGEPGASANWST